MIFSAADFKNASKSILEAPVEVDNANNAKVDALASKETFLAKDGTNKLFFESVLSNIKSYHDELAALNGQSKTTYDAANIDLAASLAQGNIHVGGTWPNFIPKYHESMSGLSLTALPSHEIYQLAEMNKDITFLKTGFSDGNTSGTLSSAYSGGTTVSSNTSFPVGHRIVVGGGSNSALLLVKAITANPGNPAAQPPVPPSTSLTVEVIAAPSGSIGQGASIRNFFSGFTNTERENNTSTFPEIMSYLRARIASQKGAIKGFITTQKTALETNGTTGEAKTANLAAKAQAEAALSTISSWEAIANTGLNSKYGNTGLAVLQNLVTTRTNFSSARQAEVLAALGSVSQATNGDYSGDGLYLSLSKWINLRCNLSNGSLRNYYDFDNILRFFDESIKLANQKKEEFEAFMLAFQLQPGSGGNICVLTSTTGLAIGNSVKVMDDDAPIMDATITNIVGLSVTLSSPISGYSLDKIARLVKPL